jgi:hypothetical protein
LVQAKCKEWVNHSLRVAEVNHFLHLAEVNHSLRVAEVNHSLPVAEVNHYQNSYLYKQTKSVNNRKTVKTVMILTWYRLNVKNG